MKRAWAAVQDAGIPEPLQEMALKEALATLRATSEEPAGSPGPTGAATRKGSSRRAPRQEPAAEETTAPIPDEDTFFGQLASESGVDEGHLRDTLQLRPDGEVRVTTPTKDIGSTITEQARAVITLIASARSRGLNETPVDAQKVRAELSRKGCYDASNFAFHLRPLKGFNASGRNEIVLTSKWVGEFGGLIQALHESGNETNA